MSVGELVSAYPVLLNFESAEIQTSGGLYFTVKVCFTQLRVLTYSTLHRNVIELWWDGLRAGLIFSVKPLELLQRILRAVHFYK